MPNSTLKKLTVLFNRNKKLYDKPNVKNIPANVLKRKAEQDFTGQDDTRLREAVRADKAPRSDFCSLTFTLTRELEGGHVVRTRHLLWQCASSSYSRKHVRLLFFCNFTGYFANLFTFR